MAFDIEKFRAALRRIIGDEKQVVFARTRGVTPEHLSRLLRSDNVSRPSRNTLKKLAGGSQADFAELMEACGYVTDSMQAVMQEVMQADEERARNSAEEIRENMAAMTKGCRVYNNLSEFLDEYAMLYDRRGASFRICPKKEYEGEGHFGAEFVAPVIARFSWGMRACRIWTAVFFSETKGGKVVVLDAAIDGASLVGTSAAEKEETREYIKSKPFVYEVRDETGMSAEERLLKAVFGEDIQEIPYTYIGFGIDFLPEDFSDDLKAGFIAIHAGSLGEENMVWECLRNAPVEKAIEELNETLGAGEGFGNIIATIMSDETGLPFGYFESFNKDKKSAVMVEQGKQGNLNIQEMEKEVRKYAAELGLKEFGNCVVYSSRYVQTDKRFRTDAG